MSLIKLTDTPMDIIIKLSEGNPGAVTTLMEIFSRGDKIDPDGALGGLGAGLALGIKGFSASGAALAGSCFVSVGETIQGIISIKNNVQYLF